MYTAKRRLMMDALAAAGLTYRVPEGTYFLLANYSHLYQGSPMEFARYLIREIGVVSIPPESFYSEQHAHIGNGYVRFAFCKSDEMLLEAKQRLGRLRG
jgi:N-succinyldiaminopimelate aminotransferase